MLFFRTFNYVVDLKSENIQNGDVTKFSCYTAHNYSVMTRNWAVDVTKGIRRAIVTPSLAQRDPVKYI